jgi:glycosyltransferase involved in cell wall biosynthesis
VYIGGFELPDKNAAAQRVIAIAKILKDVGYNVYFIGTDKSLNTDVDLMETKSIFDGFVYYNRPYPKSLKEWYHYLCDISYKSLIEEINPSLIIAYNYPAVALNKFRKYCKENDIRLIADSTEWGTPQGKLIFRLIKGFDTWYRMKIIHNQIDGIITISKYLYEYYSTRNNNVICIPPLVDKSMDKWIKGDLYKMNSSEIALVYAGSPGNGGKDRLDRIIHAVQIIFENYNLPIRLNIVGITKKQYFQFFKPNKLQLLSIDEFASFKGRLSHNDTLSIVKSSDFEIFVRNDNKTNNAGFPTKFVEAISCGTPVLTNLTSNIGMYLHNGVNGFSLDLSNDNTLCTTLYNAISVHRNDIFKMKEYCYNSRDFDYHTYLGDFTLFIDKIFRLSNNVK